MVLGGRERRLSMKVDWISVKDRLPEPFVSVFVYGKMERNTFDNRGRKVKSEVAPFTDVDFMTDKENWYYYGETTYWAEIEYPDPPADDEP
jgi:3'-phosphoadenosine 5'-phosphosulfate sulfotransferase